MAENKSEEEKPSPSAAQKQQPAVQKKEKEGLYLNNWIGGAAFLVFFLLIRRKPEVEPI